MKSRILDLKTLPTRKSGLIEMPKLKKLQKNQIQNCKEWIRTKTVRNYLQFTLTSLNFSIQKHQIQNLKIPSGLYNIDKDVVKYEKIMNELDSFKKQIDEARTFSVICLENYFSFIFDH